MKKMMRSRYKPMYTHEPGVKNDQKPVGCEPNKAIMVEGNDIIDIAKIIGITPAIETLIGIWVLCPPYILRPTIRFAY